MGLFNHFPYLNMHELNLNWIIEQVKANKTDIEVLQAIAEPASMLVSFTGSLTAGTPKVGTVTANVTPLQVYNMLGNDTDPFILSVKLAGHSTVMSCLCYATKGSAKGNLTILAKAYQYVDASTTNEIDIVLTGSGSGWTALVELQS